MENCIVDESNLQVPIKELFLWAKDIFETLNEIIIPNQCPAVIRGPNCAIEFDFFEYDSSNREELREISLLVGEKVLFLGMGFDIIGDWLVGESGKIYFRDKVRNNRVSYMARDIYDFLARAIYSPYDMNKKHIFY